MKLVFKKGEILKLIRNKGMNAGIGSTALVLKNCYSRDEYVSIKWLELKNPKCINLKGGIQIDGEYYPSDFKTLENYKKTYIKGVRVVKDGLRLAICFGVKRMHVNNKEALKIAKDIFKNLKKDYK